MAMLALVLPKETGRLFQSIDVPGKRETFSHITVVNFGDEMPIKDVAHALEVAYKVTSKTKPFSVRATRITCFPGADKVPVICPVESEELHTLWERLCEAFDKEGMNFSKKFPVFKPHVTLSFTDEPIDDQDIPPIEWGAHELILMGGDMGDQGVSVRLPFTLFQKVANNRLISRVAFRYALRVLGEIG